MTLYVEDSSLSEAMNRYPESEAVSVLDAFAEYAARLHEEGIEHLDLHCNNVLYRRDALTGELRFQLIDVNRMHFHRTLSLSERMFNFRRLTFRTDVFVHVLERYAAASGYDVDRVLCKGQNYRRRLERNTYLRSELRRRLHIQRPWQKDAA